METPRDLQPLFLPVPVFILVTVDVVRVADVVLELARRSLEPQWSSPVKAKKKDRTPPHPKG